TRPSSSGWRGSCPPSSGTTPCPASGGSTSATRGATGSRCSHLPPARQRTAERDLVGVLEVAADGEAARETGDADAAAQAVGQVGGGRLAGHVRVGRENDLLDAVPLDAPHQLVDAQVGGLDA